MARIFNQVVISLFDTHGVGTKSLAYGLCSVPFFAVGLLMPRLEQGYPWRLNVAFVAAGIMPLGIALRKTLLIFAVQKEIVLPATFVASLVASFLERSHAATHATSFLCADLTTTTFCGSSSTA